MTSHSTLIPSTFIGGILLYSCLYAITGPISSSPRYTKLNTWSVVLAARREVVQFIHCILITVSTLICLWKEVRVLYACPATGWTRPKDSDLILITHTSSFANALTTLELAYLIVDSCILLRSGHSSIKRPRSAQIEPAHVRSNGALHKHSPAHSSDVQAKQGPGDKIRQPLNYVHLYVHHTVLVSLLIWLQYALLSDPGRRVGILIIVSFLLMNASSPLGTVRWFLLNFRISEASSNERCLSEPSRKDITSALRLTTCAYLVVFAICRLGVFYMIMKTWGDMQGISPFKAWRQLRWQCKLGFSTMVVVNTLWWINGTSKFLRRELKEIWKSKQE